METKPHPLEKLSGMTKTITLPLSGAEVVIRKLDMQVLTTDSMLAVLRPDKLQEVAADYAKSVNEARGEDVQSAAMDVVINQAEALKAIQRKMLREGTLRPTLDELRTEVYGGQPDSSDLGMGPDYSALLKAVEEFNSVEDEKKAGEADKDAARTFPEKVGGGATRTSD